MLWIKWLSILKITKILIQEIFIYQDGYKDCRPFFISIILYFILHTSIFKNLNLKIKFLHFYVKFWCKISRKPKLKKVISDFFSYKKGEGGKLCPSEGGSYGSRKYSTKFNKKIN